VSIYLRNLGISIENRKSKDTKPYRGYKIERFVGCNTTVFDVEKVSPEFLKKPLFSPEIYVKHNEKIFKHYYPRNFMTKSATFCNGKMVNCFSIAMMHLFEKEYAWNEIKSKDLIEIIQSISEIELLELLHFNPNYVNRVNRKRRARNNKATAKGAISNYKPLKKLEYWKVFQRGSGCLLIECSTRNGAGTTHMIVLNFCGFNGNGYIYEEGDSCLTLPEGKIYDKAESLKILAKFRITTLRRVWLLASKVDLPEQPSVETLYHNIDNCNLK